MTAAALAAGQATAAVPPARGARPALIVRRAAPGDRAALAEMFDRCSSQTRYRRFHGRVNAFPRRYLDEALAGLPVHFALVACTDAGRVVALASCRAEAVGVAELGILVEDAYQRRGIGAVLLREIAGYAGRTGLTTLKAQVLGEQSWIARLLGAYGSCESAIARGVLEVSVRVTG
jgi:GNAT superfamily N-acetyltransferase